jgi:amino acid transporter
MYIALNGHNLPITYRYFNDICRNAYPVLDRTDCSQFNVFSMLNIPGAALNALGKYFVRYGMIGGIFFVASIASVLALPGMWADVQAQGMQVREKLARRSLPTRVLLCAVGAYVGIAAIVMIVAFMGGIIAYILLVTASFVSSIAALLMWLCAPPLLLLAALLRPVEFLHALHTLKNAVGALIGLKRLLVEQARAVMLPAAFATTSPKMPSRTSPIAWMAS